MFIKQYNVTLFAQIVNIYFMYYSIFIDFAKQKTT